MKVLSIGNSFSQDAQRYLHRLAKHEGVKIKAVNLYIGSCTLRRHYLNMLNDQPGYDFEFNGESTGLKASIRQALSSDDWDFVTLQQASPFSGCFETYTPYLEELTAYVKKYCPHTKVLIHQTWAYEEGCEKLQNLGLYNTAREMLDALCDAYDRAAKAVNADGLIPCGRAMMAAHDMGIEKIHRDTFHASRGAGRYLLALCWFRALTGKDISENTFDELDEPISDEDRAIVIRAVQSVF